MKDTKNTTTANVVVEVEEIELKNVLVKKTRTTENLKVKVIPFDRYNDKHVEFAYAYSDMLYRAPSSFTNVDDTSRAYVKLFLVHKEAEEKKDDSVFTKVSQDLRACRTLFNQDNIMGALNDFFENA